VRGCRLRSKDGFQIVFKALELLFFRFYREKIEKKIFEGWRSPDRLPLDPPLSPPMIATIGLFSPKNFPKSPDTRNWFDKLVLIVSFLALIVEYFINGLCYGNEDE
jgi:hypothetical protein